MVLLIDNYDSFTYNLYDYIRQLGYDCLVLRNDERSLEEIAKLNFSHIVLSPGPCTPAESGLCMSLIAAYHQSFPILGVCLGHQALGLFFGAKLVKAQRPMHGKTSKIKVDTSSAIFTDLNEELEVMRYHSLILEDLLPPMKVIAQTKEGEIMAIAHESLPLVGVQFHPESILTKDGLSMLKNFLKPS